MIMLVIFNLRTSQGYTDVTFLNAPMRDVEDIGVKISIALNK